MIQTKFNLIPVYISKNDYKYKIILDKETNTFPTFGVEAYVDLYEIIKLNIKLYVKSESDIYNIKLTDVLISDCIYVYIIVFLPYDTITTNMSETKEILNIYEILPKNSQQIISLL